MRLLWGPKSLLNGISLSLIVIFGFAPPSFAKEDLFQFEGKTFRQSGPNCFGVALRLAGHHSTFRGVDVKEFQSFLDLFCEEVIQPKRGDLVVYEAPLFSPIHAAVHLDKKTGIDKHNFKSSTAIQIRAFETIDFFYLSSFECRQYARGDMSYCLNQKKFFHCDSSKKKTPFFIKKFEQKVASFLEREVSGKEKESLLLEWSQLNHQLQDLLSSSSLFSQEKFYLIHQMESLRKQIKFFQVAEF